MSSATRATANDKFAAADSSRNPPLFFAPKIKICFYTKGTAQESSMSDHPHLIEQIPHTPRTDASWRNGSLSYDLSRDEELAAAGDENAEARLRTRRRLEASKLAQPCAYSAV